MTATIPAEVRKWRILWVVMISQFLTSLMTNAVNIAVTPISRIFGLNVDDGEWLLLAYLLALTSFLMPFGRLGDIFGHRRLFVAGFALMGSADFACVFATNFWLLVSLRFVEGLGAGLLQAVSSAIITESFPSRERGKALGLNGAAVAVGWSIGPVIGGAITTFAGWRYIFLLTLPFAVYGVLASRAVLERTSRRAEPVDVTGAVFASIGLFALCLALSRAHSWGYTTAPTLGALALAVAAGCAFFLTESRVEHPMLDLRLFDNRVFAFSVFAAVLYFTSVNAIIFTFPIELQTVQQMSGFEAGTALMPLAVTIAVISPFAGSLSDRISARYLASFGAAVVGIGALALTRIELHGSMLRTALHMMLLGVGIGFFNQPNNSTIMGNAPRERLGTAAAILATARATGGLLGAAIAGAIYFLRVSQLGPQAAHTTAPAATVYATVALFSFTAVAVSYARGRTGKAAPAT